MIFYHRDTLTRSCLTHAYLSHIRILTYFIIVEKFFMQTVKVKKYFTNRMKTLRYHGVFHFMLEILLKIFQTFLTSFYFHHAINAMFFFAFLTKFF